MADSVTSGRSVTIGGESCALDTALKVKSNMTVLKIRQAGGENGGRAVQC